MEKNSLEETLQDAKLHRQLSSLIVAHLHNSKLYQAASAVASATMTSLNAKASRNRLLELVSKGLAVEKDEMLRGVSLSAYDLGTSVASRYGVIPATHTAAVDFGCARFSPDGKFVATGSSDTSIKLFEVSKIKQMMPPEARDGPVRPIIRTFDDHLQPKNDLDFHPQNTVLISGSKDQTIKFFDFYKMIAKRAFRVIQDTHNVHSVSFHPSGDFLLAGTDHPIPHLYDVNTFQCYLSANAPDIDVNGAVNLAVFNDTEEFGLSIDEPTNEIVIWDAMTADKVAK